MTQQHGATRRTCGHFVHKWRVWGATPTSNFFGPGREKISSVATLELLAGTWKDGKLLFFLSIFLLRIIPKQNCGLLFSLYVRYNK